MTFTHVASLTLLGAAIVSMRTSGWSTSGGISVVTVVVSVQGWCTIADATCLYSSNKPPKRSYCDKEFKADLRQNCRYFLRNDSSYVYADRKSACCSRASLYYGAVKGQTGNHHDSGHWGHNGST